MVFSGVLIVKGIKKKDTEKFLRPLCFGLIISVWKTAVVLRSFLIGLESLLNRVTDYVVVER